MMRIVFIGTGEIGLPVLRWLWQSEHELVGVVTQPDKPVGREQRVQASPIKAAVEIACVPIFQPKRISRAEAIAALGALKPDVIAVMAYGQILPRAVLEIPRIACLNLHASLLPRHRGAAPIQAAIAAGDVETGITVMYMDDGLDTGDILLEVPIAVAPDDTGGSLHDRLAKVAPGVLQKALNQLASGAAARLPQNAADATYAPKLEREHGRIDWSEPAEIIERKIRAFDPWPGAYAAFADAAGRERKLKIFRASIVPRDTAEAMVIATGENSLRLEEVQLEGKKRMTAAELLRGHPWLEKATPL